jgi:hypothetical protein
MAQQQQSNMIKPQKVGGFKPGLSGTSDSTPATIKTTPMGKTIGKIGKAIKGGLNQMGIESSSEYKRKRSILTPGQSKVIKGYQKDLKK